MDLSVANCSQYFSQAAIQQWIRQLSVAKRKKLEGKEVYPGSIHVFLRGDEDIDIDVGVDAASEFITSLEQDITVSPFFSVNDQIHDGAVVYRRNASEKCGVVFAVNADDSEKIDSHLLPRARAKYENDDTLTGNRTGLRACFAVSARSDAVIVKFDEDFNVFLFVQGELFRLPRAKGEFDALKAALEQLLCNFIVPGVKDDQVEALRALLETRLGAPHTTPAAKTGYMLVPKPSQTECFEYLKARNAIFNMETGAGKTFIAVLALDYFLETQPTKKIMFIAPTRQLVDQHVRYIEKHSQVACEFRIKSLMGQEMDEWTPDMWRGCIRDHDIFVGTPETFRRAIVNLGAIDLAQFSLVIFDECHHAVGNAPMAAICRDGIFLLKQPEKIRVVGLTASFVNGAQKNIAEKRKKLQELLQANIHVPKHDPTVDARHDVVEERVDWDLAQASTHMQSSVREAIKDCILKLFSKFDEDGVAWETKGTEVATCMHVYEQLGMQGLQEFLVSCVIPQLREKLEKLKQYVAESEKAAERVAALQKFFDQPGVEEKFVADAKAAVLRASALLHGSSGGGALGGGSSSSAAAPEGGDIEQSAKFKKLVEVLRDDVLKKFLASGGEDRGIVFVSRVATTVPMKNMLLNSLPQGVGAGAISGVGSMSDQMREVTLNNFRNGQLRILVASPSAEEGLDVPSCSFVIRYDEVTTTRAYIQGGGRARQNNARILFFANDPKIQQQNKRVLQQYASADLLKSSDADLLQARERNKQKSHQFKDVHPYRHRRCDENGAENIVVGGEINIFNAKVIAMEYCQKVMGQPVPMENLLDVETTVIRNRPLMVKKKVSKIKLPSPKGWLECSAEDVNAHWGDVCPSEVAEEDRTQNWGKDDWEEARFFFVGCVRLAQEGCLDEMNQATKKAILRTGDKCDPIVLRDVMKLRTKFSEASIQGGGAAGGYKPASGRAGGGAGLSAPY